MLSLFSWPNRLGQWNKLPCYMRRDSTQMFRYYFQLFGRIFNVITNVISTNDRISEKKKRSRYIKNETTNFYYRVLSKVKSRDLNEHPGKQMINGRLI